MFLQDIKCLGCSKILDDDEWVAPLSKHGKEYMVRLCCARCMSNTENHEKFVKDGWFINETK
jgi:hypothetical protein